MQSAVVVMLELTAQRPDLGPRIRQDLRGEFALRALDEVRNEVLFLVASHGPVAPDCAEFLAPYEPNIPWNKEWLTFRQQCYELTGGPRKRLAERELLRFQAAEPAPLLPTPEPTPSPAPAGEDLPGQRT